MEEVHAEYRLGKEIRDSIHKQVCDLQVKGKEPVRIYMTERARDLFLSHIAGFIPPVPDGWWFQYYGMDVICRQVEGVVVEGEPMLLPNGADFLRNPLMSTGLTVHRGSGTCR